MDYFIWLTLLDTDTIKILTPIMIIILLIIGAVIYLYYFKRKLLNLFVRDKDFTSKMKKCKTKEESNKLVYETLIKKLTQEDK